MERAVDDTAGRGFFFLGVRDGRLRQLLRATKRDDHKLARAKRSRFVTHVAGGAAPIVPLASPLRAAAIDVTRYTRTRWRGCSDLLCAQYFCPPLPRMLSPPFAFALKYPLSQMLYIASFL